MLRRTATASQPVLSLARSGTSVSFLPVSAEPDSRAPCSATQLHDAGIPYVLLGHSERRTLFHETSEEVATKTRAALDAGLSVVLCIGETLQERESGETARVCEGQLAPVVAALKEADWRFALAPTALPVQIGY